MCQLGFVRPWVRAPIVGLMLVAGSVAFSQEAAPKLSAPPEPAIAAFSTAANAQNAGEFGLAAELWADFLNKYPTVELTPQAEHYCGVCNLKLQHYDIAAQHFQAVVAKWSKVAGFGMVQDAYLNLGWCQYSLAGQGKDNPAALYDSAANAFAALVKQFPDGTYTDQALYFHGESLYHQNKKQEAIGPYTQLVNDTKHRNSSLRANALYALGVTYEELSQFPKAGQVYDVFLQQFSNHELITEVRMRKAETVLQAGLAAKAAGKIIDASGLIQQAAEMFADVTNVKGFDQADHAVFRQGFCQVELGRPLDAARSYARIPTEFAQSVYAQDATINAGRFYYRGQSYEEAMKWLERVIDGDAANRPEAAHWVCRIYLRNGQPAKAYELAKQVLPSAGDSKFLVDLTMDQADAAYEMPDRKPEALRLYLQLSADNPQHELAPQALYNAAFGALDLKQYDESLKNCAKFLQTYKDNLFTPDVKYVAAECNLLSKKLADAEAGYRDLIANHSMHADVAQWKLRLGLVLYLQEKYEETVQWLAGQLSGFKAPDTIAEARFLMGSSQFDRQQFEAAIKEFESSLATSSKWRQADETLLRWSQALHKLNKTGEAIALVKQLINEFPASNLRDQAQYRYGEFSYAIDDFETAIDQYTIVIDRWADSAFAPYAHFGKGWGQLKTNEFAAGVQTFTTLLTKYAGHSLIPDTLLARGMCRRQTGDLKGAVDDLAAFLKSNPPDGDKCNALYEKGLAEVGLKELPAAIKSFSDLLLVDPKCTIADKALYELAWAYKTDGQDDEALKHFRRIATEFASSPLVAEAHFHDAEDLYRQEKYADAAKAYGLAKQKSSPGELQEKVVYKLGWSEYQQALYESALKQFRDQIQIYSAGSLKADALFMVAECLFRLNRHPEAVPAFAAAWNAMATSTSTSDVVKSTILLHAGQSALEQEQYDVALKSLRQIPADFPDSVFVAQAYFETGRALQGLEKHGEALKAYEEAATKSRGEVGARARFMMGEVYFFQKQYGEAIKQFQICIFGYNADPADEKVLNWKAKSGFEAARCAEVRIAAEKDASQRKKLIDEATKFYNYVVTKHPKHELTAQAKSRLAELSKLN